MDREGKKEAPRFTPSQKATSAPAGESAQQKKDYIGCLMSLVSKQEIRYTGTLIAINSREQTLVLQNVKSHGSEGRRGGEEVLPSTQVFDKVSFRAAELKDFYVIKGPENEFKDPAIISQEKVEEKKEDEKKEDNKVPAQDPQAEEHVRRYYEYRGERDNYMPRRGRYRPRGRGRMEGKFQEHSIKEVQEKYAREFDFESMNKKFEELFKENEKSVEVEAKYDKSKSFYDEISRGKEEKTTTPYERHKQREINAVTFDFDPQYNERRGGYYPRYRGRWRGGYRRGRGYDRRGQQPYYRRGAA
eukprot:TRINITY_DN3400_c0_g1_i5.p1 TRINITY_DN3400_c0_g1~~TRINITY_DN3400_c0_g1_i5.p1  ORF type:complete len:302 (-),score=76.33 TRINITY_DN3400_c0_g1_i5:94-999(-)